MKTINYKAEPTAAKFHASNKVCRGFKGPVGNGKSVTCIMEMWRLANEQWPNVDGVRKSRWAIVRNTTPELRTTTLNTFKQWIPESIAPVTTHPIIISKVNQPLADGTRLEAEFIFLAIDRDDDVKKLLSLEVTGIFCNEARELTFALIKAARERIGRYPSLIDGYEDDPKKEYKGPRDEYGKYQPCRRKALLMDTNPPDDDHWWYHLAVNGHLEDAENIPQAKKQTAEIFDFFDGPSPLIKSGSNYEPNPNAENIDHLPGGYKYYLDMIAGNNEDHINVQVLGNYGTIKTGRPVYPQFNDNVHVADGHLMPIEGREICLGWDFGLTPSCIIGQVSSIGQVRIIAELQGDNIDVRSFARDVVKPYLQRHFSEFEIGFSLGDPAGNNKGEGEGKSAIGILNDEYVAEFGDEPLEMGFITEPAPTNDPTQRTDSVSRYLSKLVGNGQVGFILAKRCKVLRKGFNGAYCYERLAVRGKTGVFRDKPDKGKYSHAHDALQYLCLGFVGGYVTDGYNDEYLEDYETESDNPLGY